MKKFLLCFFACLFLLNPINANAGLLNDLDDALNESSNSEPVEDQSLSDIMREVPKEQNENIDTNVMDSAQDKIGNTIGVLTSVVIYLIFAGIAFTTSCDLMYIAVPMSRQYLNTKSQNQQSNSMYGQQNQSQGYCLVSDTVMQILNQQQRQMTSGYLCKEYLKRRSVTVIIGVIVLMLLVTTSVFTDFGLNIGAWFYYSLKSLLAF